MQRIEFFFIFVFYLIDLYSFMQILKSIFITCLCIIWGNIVNAQTDKYLQINSDSTVVVLTIEGAQRLADMAMKCIDQEYPNKTNHFIQDAADTLSPEEMHPAFYGCLDWHSAVHGHWMLVKLLKSFPDLPKKKEIITALNAHFTSEKMQKETAYFRKKGNETFERMYGWAWYLKLDMEIGSWEDSTAQRWHKNMKPLTQVIADKYIDFLPRQTYVIRTGVHPNTAFGLSLALDYARWAQNGQLESFIVERGTAYYKNDENCPATWEPGGEDFFSPCLMEADFMRRILPQPEFTQWMRTFLPAESLQHLRTPAIVSDRSDYKIVHLDGLNLSRAWCMKGIASHVTPYSPIKGIMQKAALRHITTALPYLTSDSYAGGHWLASFAVYALLER